MPNIFIPSNFQSALGPYAININDCMGDSVGIINANTNYLAAYTASVSATTTTQINNLSSLIFTPPNGGILEHLSNVCDGSQVQGRTTTYTWPQVLAAQDISTETFTNVNGSILSYTPPPGAKKVIYRFNYHTSVSIDANPILSFKFYIAGQEVEWARYTSRADGYYQSRVAFEWAIGVGGTSSNQTGRQSSWTTAKELKLMTRCYTTDYQGRLHATYNYAPTDGVDGTTSTQLSLPTLTIIATT
jgi:hypothetical protein